MRPLPDAAAVDQQNGILFQHALNRPDDIESVHSAAPLLDRALHGPLAEFVAAPYALRKPGLARGDILIAAGLRERIPASLEHEEAGLFPDNPREPTAKAMTDVP